MITLTVAQIKYAIDHCSKIVEQQHYTDEMSKADHKNGFYYDDALEYEGFFIIPVGDKPQDIDFDYGDTNSGGEVLDQTSPMAPIPDFTENLRADLEQLLNRKQKELAANPA